MIRFDPVERVIELLLLHQRAFLGQRIDTVIARRIEVFDRPETPYAS